MMRFLKISAVVLLLGSSALAYTNVLENGSSQLVTNRYDISGQDLVVGDTTMGNTMQINAGGAVSSQSGYVGRGIGGDSNSLRVFGATAVLTNSGSLYVGDAGSSNVMEIEDAGRVVAGNVYIGNGTNAINNRFSVIGSNSTLEVSGELVVGALNEGGNSLQVDSYTGIDVGGGLTVHSNNFMTLASDTSFAVGGDINFIGNATIVNSLSVGEGMITLTNGSSKLNFIGATTDTIGTGIKFMSASGSDAVAFSGGQFRVSSDLTNRFANFQALELTNSELTGHGSIGTASFGAVDMSGGSINPMGDDGDIGTLTIEGRFNPSGTVNYKADIDGAQNDMLVVNDPAGVNLSALDLDVHVISAPANPNVSVLSAPNGLSGNFNSVQITDDLVLYDATMTVNPANGSVDITTTADPTKFDSAMALAGTEGIRAGHSAMKNSVFTRPKQLRRNLVSTAHSMSQEAFLLSGTNSPAGPQGPGDQNTIFDMHVWLQYFSGEGSFDGSTGYDMYHHGSTIGADRLFGEALTLGFNYTFARSSASTDSRDKIDTETYWLGAYGEWIGDDGLYVDALASIGFSDYDSERRAKDYRATASYDGLDFGSYVDVGQHYYYKNIAISPYAGLHFLTAVADEHHETNTDGKRVKVDEVERAWLESALGLKARCRYDTIAGRIQLTGFAEWTHDFIQDDIDTTMQADGLAAVRMKSISPDADVFSTGIGLSWMRTDYMEVGIGYNGRFTGDSDEHTGSLMIDIMF